MLTKHFCYARAASQRKPTTTPCNASSSEPGSDCCANGSAYFRDHSHGTKAQQYLHRARQFRDAASDLPDSLNGEQNWPRYALLMHAMELALKAFAFHSAGDGPIVNEPTHHDLMGWYKVAVGYGLEDERTVSENVSLLHELHKIHFLRYPKQLPGPVPNLEVIVDQTVEHLISTFTLVVNPR